MIPTRFLNRCEFCKLELDTREPGVHQYTRGWVKNRSGGGGHGVSLPERELRWAHGYCIERQTEGTFGQASIFGDAPVGEPPPVIEPQPTNASFDRAGMLVHVCNVCGGDAPFGIGVDIPKGQSRPVVLPQAQTEK